MSWKIPCNATEGRFYNGGKGCSKCGKCPGGQGRNMSKRVLNTSEKYGDLECIKCEVCPPNMFNNGGREGCMKCLDDCALRNRYNCPEKATQQCGECLDGYFADYQIDDDPSTCIQCTEKEKSIIPACANLTTTASSAIDTTPLSSSFRENIPVINKAVESNNENLSTGNGYWYPSLLALGILTSLIVVFLAILVICRYYNKRRKRQHETDQRNRTGDGPLLAGTSGYSVNSPLIAGTSGYSVNSPLIAGTSGYSVDSPILTGTSGYSVNSPLQVGASGNYIDSPVLAGTSIDSFHNQFLAGTSGNSVDSPLRAGTSGVSDAFPLVEVDANKMAYDDFTLNKDLETDANPVPKRMDRNRWIHRQDLLKSKIYIHQLCAKRWTDLDSEYPELSMPDEEVELLKKEAQSKNWPQQELNFQILSRWAQIKGNQATVESLCDALFSKELYDIIEDILKENPSKEIKLSL